MLFEKDKLLLIAGPCSLENEALVRSSAETLKAIAASRPELTLIFKGSFDKANRTSLTSARGPGLEEGLELLRLAREEYGLPVLTDIHTVEQAERVAEVSDCLQIPAFLCRQTDLLVAAARTGRVVNVKKGQFLSPYEMAHVVSKLEASEAAEIWQTERGTLFGYQNLVVDMRGLALMRGYGHPVIMDATHAVQLPGASAGQSGGDRRFVPLLARSALAAGADGLFLETHPRPDEALSDAASQWPLDRFESLIDDCLAIWRTVHKMDRTL